MEAGIGISNVSAWSPDNRTSTLPTRLRKTIFAYDFDLDTGAIRNRRVFADCHHQPGTPDGSTIDAEGFLWNAHWDGWKLVRYAPDGRVDRDRDAAGAEADKLHVRRPGSGDALRDLGHLGSGAEALKDSRTPAACFALDVGVRGLPEPRFAG